MRSYGALIIGSSRQYLAAVYKAWQNKAARGHGHMQGNQVDKVRADSGTCSNGVSICWDNLPKCFSAFTVKFAAGKASHQMPPDACKGKLLVLKLLLAYNSHQMVRGQQLAGLHM
jgi:hypothetical protein